MLLGSRQIWALDCVNLNPATASELTAIIRNPSCRITSIDDLLKVLIRPSKPVLLYKSQSLQGPHKTDYMNPRAVVGPYGNDRRQLFLAFNGNSSQSEYKNLEVLAVNKDVPKPSAEVADYYDYQFNSEDQNLPWAQAQQMIEVSQANPQTCVLCHGSPARPIFSGYPLWPGTYGSFDLTVDLAEKQHWKDFESQAPSMKRYRYLNLAEDLPDFYKDDKGRPVESILIGVNNGVLNSTLSHANSLRVARLAQQTPDYSPIKYAAMGAMLNCEGVEGFFPDDIRQKMESNLDKTFKLTSTYQNKEIEATLTGIYDSGPDQFGAIHDMLPSYSEQTSLNDFSVGLKNYWGASSVAFKLWLDTATKEGPQRVVSIAAKLRYVFESRGIDISEWFMDLRQPTYRLLDGSKAGQQLGVALFEDDPDFSSLPAYKDYDPEKTNALLCEKLKTLSLKTLSHFNADTLSSLNSLSSLTFSSDNLETTPNIYPKTFINTCAKCHDSAAAFAPRIPFASEKQFQSWISIEKNRELVIKRLNDPEPKRMPMTRNLPPEELAHALQYLSTFKSRFSSQSE